MVSNLSDRGANNDNVSFDTETLIIPSLDFVNGSQKDNEAKLPRELKTTNGVQKSKATSLILDLNDTSSNHRIDGLSGTGKIEGTSTVADPIFALEDIAEGDGKAPPQIAIVGMGMRLPGGVNAENDFWDMLVNKKNGRGIVPKDRYNIDAFYSANGGPGTVKTKHGYFLEHVDLQHLDTSFFSMNKSEVEKLDPQQRMLLEVVWECMDNGGQVGWRGKNIGCYVGVFGEDWLDMAAKDTQHLGMYRISGSGDFAISNRVSYEYNLKGPSMTIRTGCSSSLVGLHEACQAIYSGECHSAVVAGTNLIMTPTMTIAMTEQGVLSPTGLCKTFDAKADGYARGEAINAVYIKKLSDAINDGDPVRAVIRATTTNCDGKTPGISYPSSESHELMIRRAYQLARLPDLSKTAFIECHGTGTAIGDPLETAAIANVFGHDGIFIGSVKPNVGHSEGASGITSLIKTVLALEHRVIPPNINFDEPNPKIPFENARLQVPLEATRWPDHCERASVNSFGIGGANAHVIVDSAASFGIRSSAKVEKCSAQDRPHLLVFSATHPNSLTSTLEKYQQLVTKDPHLLKDLAHTLGARREHLPHRAYCVTDGRAPFETSTITKPKPTPKLVFVFTGQGAQWAGMAKQLFEDFAEFRNEIRAMDNVLAELPTPPPWTIEGELAEGEGSNRIDDAEFSQPLCTAVQIALVKLLRGWGVFPAAVVGHSSGEIAAAYTSNAITAKSAIMIAYYRGQVCLKQLGSGGMLAIGMGPDIITPYLIKGVVVACENSPESVTLSGDKTQINKIAARIADEQPDVFVRQLKVEVPYHSHYMEQVGAEYHALLNGHVPTEQIEVPFFSSVTGKNVSDSIELGPSYWRRNLESPVLFSSATRALLGQLPQGNVFLEIGPHSALASPLRQIFKAVNTEEPQVYVPSLIRERNCTRSLLTAVGQMYLLSVSIKFEAVTPGNTVLTSLPTYPWNHETRYWSESRTTWEWRTRRFPKHELLGSRILEGNELEPTWRNMVRLEDVPWIQDHKIINDVVFPAAGYITMAGEAMRQLTETNDFTVRHVLIRTAMVFQDSKPTEMMTSLRPVQLTTALDSEWYEVVISSYNGTLWIKHFTCQVRAGQDQAIRAEPIDNLPREVPAPTWYSAMRRIGLNYGPAFQGLNNISASPQHGTSVASLLDQHRSADAFYELHPTTIDSCLQLFTVGMSGGVTRHFQKLCVPTEIEELYIRQGVPEMRIKVVASSSKTGVIKGDLVATAGTEVVIQLKGGKFSPLEEQVPGGVEDPIAGAQLDWKPDISFMHAENLMRPRVSLKEDIVKLERLALLCILETHHQLSQCETKAGHLKKFYDWLEVQTDRAETGTYPVIEEARRFAHLSHEERLESIGIAKKDVENSSGAGVGKSLLRILEHCKAIFAQQVDSIEILLQENGLKILYDFFQDIWDCQAFFELLGHAKPTLRVLEIGAGTGGTTACALKDLVTRSGERMYSQYCYTDVSAGFFVTAKERFKDFHNLQYAVLDISKDPIEQGFEAESYDLILASNVLHATPNLNLTLRHVRKLLHPQGRLLLQELTPTVRIFNYIMGILPGWWLGENDDRPFEPFVSKERWDNELQAAGFSGTDSVIYDNDLPYQMNFNILSRPEETISPTKGLTLLCEHSFSPTARQIESVFVRKGFRIDFSTIDQIPPENQDIISLMDLSTPFFDRIESKELGAFQRYIGNLKSSGILWATRSSQIGCKDPRYSQVLGIARTIRSELLVDFATFEIDTIDDFAFEALSNVFAKFQRRAKDPVIDPDWEFALFERVINIPRYHWISVAKQLSVISEEEHPRKLEVEKTGLLQSLRWVQGTPIVLTEDQIEVKTCAVGLNFKDILVCMGVVDAAKDGIGLEGAGVVHRVGSKVKDFKVGDRVIMFEHGCFSTRMAISAKLCAKIPEELSFEEAATLPCVYSTVIHSLLTIGRLEKGQTVLVQSACGGVGLAAIQICKMKGAQIYATVGSNDKAQYLVRTFGIARHHIFNSRNTSFLADVMRETNGRGVDLVLNSLSGELLHTSWKCVAEYGKMLEIGKRDFIGRGMLSMDLFEANRAFFGIDLARLGVERPEACRLLLEQCLEYYHDKAIGPIKPMKVFDAIRTVDAFKYMQKGQHIGKIVVTMPKSPQELSITAVKQEFHLRPEMSYFLVGGLGGLGRAISTWMVERGARNLIFLSRSAGKTDSDKKFFRELETQGCLVQAFSGSVTRFEDVQNAVENAAAPLAGVMHMSMVLKDRGFLEFSHDEWHTAVAPKVEGAWNLHKALLSEKLDFFVLFSSLSCAVGQRGQGNYAAANAFLNSFVQYRQGLGQPASAIDIGVMEDVGYVSQNPAVLEQLKAHNAHTLREQDLIDTLQLVMTKCTAPPPSTAGYRNPTQLAIGLRSTKPLSDPSNRSIWKSDIRMNLYRNLETFALASTGPVNEALKHFLTAVAREPSMLNVQSNVSFLTHEIGARLCNFMLQPDDDIDVKQSLLALGLDSLVAIEIRNWWRQCLGLEISVLEIMNSGSIEQLGKIASEGLLRKYEVPEVKKEDTYLLMKAP